MEVWHAECEASSGDGERQNWNEYLLISPWVCSLYILYWSEQVSPPATSLEFIIWLPGSLVGSNSCLIFNKQGPRWCDMTINNAATINCIRPIPSWSGSHLATIIRPKVQDHENHDPQVQKYLFLCNHLEHCTSLTTTLPQQYNLQFFFLLYHKCWFCTVMV